MNASLRFALLAGSALVTDAMLTYLLGTTTEAGVLVDRLLSLGAGFLTFWFLARFLPAPHHKTRPGFWPLVAVSILLNYGIFAALAERTPHVQPLVHLGVAWMGSLMFFGFGLYRISRFRD